MAEGIMSAFQSDTEFDVGDEEGAKLMKLLETAAEPEVLMAGMSSTQLASFSSYKAKLEVWHDHLFNSTVRRCRNSLHVFSVIKSMRQSEIQKSIEKAVKDAGLGEREVTPFLRLKVAGLMKRGQQECRPAKGLITIWNPTQKQVNFSMGFMTYEPFVFS